MEHLIPNTALELELQQRQELTPQQLLSMELLQMSTQELLDYLQKAFEENPVLEEGDSSDLRSAYAVLCRRFRWMNASLPTAGGVPPEAGGEDHALESLSAFLCDQLERLSLPAPMLALCRYLTELLNEDGYLLPEDLASLEELSLPEGMAEQAVCILQSLEPAGVAAGDLSQCLSLQLARKPDASDAAKQIAAGHLDALSRRHYGPIMRALGLTREEIDAAGAEIAVLEPRPGAVFQPPAPTVYARPDVFMVQENGKIEILVNEYDLPRVTIAPYYRQLFRETDDADTRSYLRQKIRQARWLMNGMERRKSTVQLCAEAIAERQHDFLTGESNELCPMSISSLARQLNMHVSTVSRAVRDKYLQCQKGTYPLRFFFSRSIAPDVSRQAVKLRLASLIRAEDPAAPLSDQALCRLLAQDGILISRRTAAKYRDELGILSSAGRKSSRNAR